MDLWVYTMKGGDASQGCAFHRNRMQGNANLPCKRLKDIKCSAKKKKKRSPDSEPLWSLHDH